MQMKRASKGNERKTSLKIGNIAVEKPCVVTVYDEQYLPKDMETWNLNGLH